MNNKIKKRKYRQVNKSKNAGLQGIFFVVIMLATIVSIRRHELNNKAEQYERRLAILEEQIKEAKKYKEELSEKKIYVQTKQYVEEVAKDKLGLVNPDEIVLRPAND
jgi:Septum formation initiator.